MSAPITRAEWEAVNATTHRLILAARVEAVLALAEKRHAHEAYDIALRDVVRLLNEEKP